MINITTIETIINSFADKGLVFSNEQDFQFRLGVELNKLESVDGVYFEMLSLEDSFESLEDKIKNNPRFKLDRKKKEYHDLVVKLKDSKYVAFELKYKTPQKICFYETNSGKYFTFSQGAYDLAAYDFLEDVARLENINKRHLPNNIKISKGYCIFLTNDKNYRFNDFSESKIWKNYSLKADKEKGELKILSDKIPYLDKYNHITLNSNYKLSTFWHDYELKGFNGKIYDDYENKKMSINPGFSYLIVEVSKFRS